MSTLQTDLLISQAYIDGRWVDADSGATFAVVNPASGETIAQVPRMGAAETRRAIEAAQRALPAWRSMVARERARLMRRWADLMMDHEDELAALLTTEQGKPIAESRVEIAHAASFLGGVGRRTGGASPGGGRGVEPSWGPTSRGGWGGGPRRLWGGVPPRYRGARRIVVARDPVGVTAGIPPGNSPAAMPTRKASPALGA